MPHPIQRQKEKALLEAARLLFPQPPPDEHHTNDYLILAQAIDADKAMKRLVGGLQKKNRLPKKKWSRIHDTKLRRRVVEMYLKETPMSLIVARCKVPLQRFGHFGDALSIVKEILQVKPVPCWHCGSSKVGDVTLVENEVRVMIAACRACRKERYRGSH